MNAAQNESNLLNSPAKTRGLDYVLRSLEGLAFAQIAQSYSCDNSFLLLILRSLFQEYSLFAASSHAPTKVSPPLTPVIVTNVLCILVHLISSAPAGNSTTRGYLHGSISIDFVGELGPVSKWRLLALDIMIFSIQLVILALGVEKEKAAEPRALGTSESVSDDLEAGITLQDDSTFSPEATGLQESPQHFVSVDVIANLRVLAQRRSTVDSADPNHEAGLLERVASRVAAIRARTNPN